MSAGFHECRKCKGNLRFCRGCRSTAGNVPIRPLGESMHIKLLSALADHPIVIIDNQRDSIAA